MDKIWYRGVIRYLQKKGITTKEIHTDMFSTLGDDAPALSTVKKWAAEFKRGRESLEDDPRSGRPSTATTQENIDRIHQMIMNDRRLTISHLANVISISRERVENILRNELDMSKVSARLVPRLLISDQKLTRILMSEANLAIFEANPDRFVECFLTQNECVGSITLNQRPKGSGSTQLLLLQRRPYYKISPVQLFKCEITYPA